MKAIIVEDEALASRRLVRIIEDLESPRIEVLHIFTSVQEIAQYLLTHPHPDLLFLDIQVEDGNTFELFNIVPSIQSSIIFTTAYSEFAIQAFRKNALDYLLKPIKLSELQEAIGKKQKISKSQAEDLRSTGNSYKNRFLIRLGSKLQIVKTEEVAYIYSENKLAYFVLYSGRKFPSDYRLSDLLTLLDPSLFFRVNRQVIIHLNAIKEIVTYSKSRVKLKLQPPFAGEVVVSTETTPKFKEWLDR